MSYAGSIVMIRDVHSLRLYMRTACIDTR